MPARMGQTHVSSPHHSNLHRSDLQGEDTLNPHEACLSSHPSRSFSPIYHFFDSASITQHLNDLIASGVPLEEATLINKCNKHPRNLSLIGILPNQLRTLIKRCSDNVDIVFEEISKVIFWEGYKIWKARKARNKNFGNIYPLKNGGSSTGNPQNVENANSPK